MSNCITLPQTVASGSFLSQTESLAETAVFTPTVSGLYRVNVGTVLITDGFSASSTVYWNDSSAARSENLSFTGPGAMVIYAASGDAISLSVTQSGTGTWSLYYSIEAL
jgi:hypothetical protein